MADSEQVELLKDEIKILRSDIAALRNRIVKLEHPDPTDCYMRCLLVSATVFIVFDTVLMLFR